MREFLWVTNTQENREFYSGSSPKEGLFLHFYITDAELKKDIRKFVKYLRNEFYFPVKCDIYFQEREYYTDSKKLYNGVFCGGDEKIKGYPEIYIAAKMPEGCEYADGRNEVLITLAHELTHYFQWYLLEDEKRTHKGMEIQASKYAKRIVSEYLEEIKEL